MIPCEVSEDRQGCLTITFPASPHRSLFLQSEDDRAAFIESCGGSLDAAEDITECPADYHDISDLDTPSSDNGDWDKAFRRYCRQRGL